MTEQTFCGMTIKQSPFGLCIGGPLAGEERYHKAPVLLAPVASPVVSSMFNDEVTLSNMDVVAYHYEELHCGDGFGNIGFWRLESESGYHAIKRLCEAYKESHRGRTKNSHEIPVTYDPDYPHFGMIGEPVKRKQHPNQQRGLDLYVSVINFATGERCSKKLYENKTGLYFKHNGYNPSYISGFTAKGKVVPFHVLLENDLEKP